MPVGFGPYCAQSVEAPLDLAENECLVLQSTRQTDKMRLRSSRVRWLEICDHTADVGSNRMAGRLVELESSWGGMTGNWLDCAF